MKVGFIGLGKMGNLMAYNVACHYPLMVYNRSQDKSIALQHRKSDITIAESVNQLSDSCDIIISMLADDKAVEEIYLKNLGVHTARASTWIEMSTISPSLSQKLNSLAQQNNIVYVDSPVAGSIDLAATGKLSLIVGSDTILAEDILAVLNKMGENIFLMGKASSGHTAKLLLNSIIHSQNQIIAEILTLTRKETINPATFMELLGGSTAASDMIRFRTPLFLQQSDANTFALKLAAKDMRLVNQLKDKHSLSLPQLEVNLNQLEQAVLAGWGDLDMAAMTQYTFKKNKGE